MLSLKVLLKDAEKAKQYVVKHKLLDKRYAIKKSQNFIFFPIIKRFRSSWSFVEIDLPERKVSPMALKKGLAASLSKDELSKVRASLDAIGDIIIVEIPKELAPKAKLIADHLLKSHPNIKTVLQKGKHEGGLRVQRLKFLAGIDKRETTHRESGISAKLDVEKVYFSPRLSEERLRIAKQVKSGEKILVMGSGCGIYPLILAKKTAASEIVGVELNADGHKYAIENARLNHLNNLRFYQGDVQKVLPSLKEAFDRILMPLPASAHEFLPLALSVAMNNCADYVTGGAIIHPDNFAKLCNPISEIIDKKNTILHFYTFVSEESFDKAKEMVRKACKQAGIRCKILKLVKCGQVGQRRFRVCVDAKLG